MLASYPRLVVDLSAIAENTGKVVVACTSAEIRIAGVTKGICAHGSIVRAMVDAGCPELADSRMTNIRSLRSMGFGLPLLLLRIPMLSEIPEVVEWADCSLVSMPETLQALDRECRCTGKEHQVIVMADMGDLREGFWPDDQQEALCTVLQGLERVRCRGVGVNFGCFGGVLPARKKLLELTCIAEEFERFLGYPLETVSGGSSSSLALLERNEIPEGVNHLRIGEAILLGTDVTSSRDIPWLRQRTMFLAGEVVELFRKPSVPQGVRGKDAFGRIPVFEDRGNRLRAIVAVGRQDVPIEGIEPERPGVTILGGSSDHLVLDVEEASPGVIMGEALRFFPDYGAMLALATSPYVGFEMV